MAFEEKPNTGVLFPNNRKEKDSHPDYRGKANYKGIEFESPEIIAPSSSAALVILGRCDLSLSSMR